MGFIQKALKLLQEFPNLKNEPFQVKDKKKRSFLEEAENFFRNLTSSKSDSEEQISETDSIDLDLDQIPELEKDSFLQESNLDKETSDLSESKDTLSEQLELNEENTFEESAFPTPIIPNELNEEDNLSVDLDFEDNNELPLSENLDSLPSEVSEKNEELIPSTDLIEEDIQEENESDISKPKIPSLLDEEDNLIIDLDSEDNNFEASKPQIPTEVNEEDNLSVELEDKEDLPEKESLSLEEGKQDSEDENIQIQSIDGFEEFAIDEIDDFSGNTETLSLEEEPELSSVIENLENEIEELKNEIALDEEPSQTVDETTLLDDWEKDAISESTEEPFLEDEEYSDKPNLTEDKTELNQGLNESVDEENHSLEKNEPIVDVNVAEAFESAKQFKSSYEEKLESYLVLFEITKELLKSKSFDDFFENLMYSIIGQVGPEVMIIFSSRDGNFSQMKIVAHEGIDIEPDYVIKKGDTLYSLLESEHDVVYAKDLLAHELKERERVLLENPLTEILIPIRVMDQFSGFIVAGKMISGEEYTEKDFEFLQILVEVSGNFLSKLFDSENLSHEVSELNKIIHSTSNITEFTDKVYGCKSLDELYDAISESFTKDFKLSNFTLMVLDVKSLDYKVFGSNFLLPETVGKFRLSKESKIITMISQVSDVYRVENYESNSELNSYISEEELSATSEFTVIPLINIGRMVGLFIIHKVSTDWSPGYKRTVLSLANVVAPIIANLMLQSEKETLFRNPFNPLQEMIEREIKYSETKNKQFTLVVLKILNVTRILNILGINFFSEYSEFISKKIFENTSSFDYVSRIGQGKFAILLKENSKSDSEKFISKIKSEIVLFHNPSRDFKLSIQIYSLTFPDQAKEKRKFIEMMEET